MMSDKIGPQHLRRKAMLYVRQSSPHQVKHNCESGAACPSSKHLGHLGVFLNGGSGSSRLMLSRLVVMGQAAFLMVRFLIFLLLSMMAWSRPK